MATKRPHSKKGKGTKVGAGLPWPFGFAPNNNNMGSFPDD